MSAHTFFAGAAVTAIVVVMNTQRIPVKVVLETWNNPQRTMEPKLTLFTVDSIGKDITAGIDKPLWPLASYGPAKYEPTLITGLDESMEELRVRAVTAIKAGTMAEYYNYETTKIASAEQVFANARSSVKEAYEQAVHQSNVYQSPAAATASFATNSSAFKPTSGPATGSVFGTPAFGQSTFGQSTFGQSGQSAFGQPATQSVFGQQSALGQQPAVSAFSQQPLTTSQTAFGQSAAAPQSAFGQPSAAQSAFGQPTTPAFGQTTAATPQSAFGQVATTAPVSAFGQPASPSVQSAFGSAFGQTSKPVSAFGQPVASTQSAFGQTSSSSLIKPATGAFSAFANPTGQNAFAAAASSNPSAGGGFSAFANPQQQQPQQQPLSAFGGQTQSAFGNSAANTNSFGSTPWGGGVQSVFGQQQQQQPQPLQPTQTQSAFGLQQSQTAQPLGAAPSSSSFITTVPLAKPRPAVSGPPDFANAKAGYTLVTTVFDQKIPAGYMEKIPAEVVAAFKSVKFEWGGVPEWVPPIELR